MKKESSWICSKCFNNKCLIEQKILKKFPNYIIACTDRKGNCLSMENRCSIESNYIINMREYSHECTDNTNYKLIGVCYNIIIGPNIAHYIVDLFIANQNKWIRFNDATIEECLDSDLCNNITRKKQSSVWLYQKVISK